MSFPIAANDEVAELEINKKGNPIRATVTEIFAQVGTTYPDCVTVVFPRETILEWNRNMNDERLCYLKDIAPSASLAPTRDLFVTLDMEELDDESQLSVQKRLDYEIAMSRANTLSSLIPNIDGIYIQLVKTVSALQGSKGYINTTNDRGNNSIHGYKFEPEMECMVECVMLGVRVRDGKLQVVGDFLPERLHLTDAVLAVESSELWEDLRYSDGYDYIPTMMNIIKSLHEYIYPENFLG